MRVRVTYSKLEAMRFTGHLDLYRAWERLIRRARLPLAYTQGYNPHPRLNLSPALPLGFTSECELIDIWLEQALPLTGIKKKLTSAAPPGIRIQKISEIELSEPAIQNEITSVIYQVRIVEPPADIPEKIEKILAAESLEMIRRNKPYDLRPLIENISVDLGNEQILELKLQLACRDGATGRPDEVLKALDLPPHLAEIHRTVFLIEDKQLAN